MGLKHQPCGPWGSQIREKDSRRRKIRCEENDQFHAVASSLRKLSLGLDRTIHKILILIWYHFHRLMTLRGTVSRDTRTRQNEENLKSGVTK